MDYDDFLLNEIVQWDIGKFNLIFKNPIIFLCGGDVDPISKPEARIYTSLRSYLIEYSSHIKAQIRTAELFKDYSFYYDDLLEFECDIASISDLVVIILEGPGALIELGLFSVKPDIFEKLVVIQHNDFSSELSFANLGPLQALKKSKENSVLDYNWPLNQEFSILKDGVLKVIGQDISAHLKSIRTQSKFNINIDAHFILFIYEIIRCFFPMTEKEILDTLQLLDFDRKFSLKQVKKIVYLLCSFELVNKYKVSNITFIYPLEQSVSKVKLTYTQEREDQKKLIFDYLRLRVGILPSIKLDDKRTLALQDIKELS